MSYFDIDEDSSSALAFSCASFVLQELDSPGSSRPSSPDPLAPAPALYDAPPLRQPVAVHAPAYQQPRGAALSRPDDSVQALIRRVEQESLSSRTSEPRREGQRRRRGDVPPRFRPSTPSQLSGATQQRSRTPVTAQSPREATSPGSQAGDQSRPAFTRKIDTRRANQHWTVHRSASPFAAQSAPPTRLSFANWQAGPHHIGERSQSPPFSDCSTLSSSSSSALHSPFEARNAVSGQTGYPFPPASPRKSADDWADSVKSLPSLEMIQQRMARGRTDSAESPTRAALAAGARQGLPSFLLARKGHASGSNTSSPPSSPTDSLGQMPLKTPPLQGGSRVFVTPPPASS